MDNFACPYLSTIRERQICGDVHSLHKLYNILMNIFWYDFNAKEIKVVNVFNHGRYKSDVEGLFNKCTDMEDFSDKLLSVTSYYFWPKCEWETVIYSWVGDETSAKKVYVFWQLKNNWSRFVEYLWEMSY